MGTLQGGARMERKKFKSVHLAWLNPQYAQNAPEILEARFL